MFKTLIKASLLFVLFFWMFPDPPVNITWNEVLSQNQPPPGIRISYGDDVRHFGKLRLPKDCASDGLHQNNEQNNDCLSEDHKFPLIVLIHGGCWVSQFEYDYFNPVAEALTNHGFAVWSVAYRRIGDVSGGWPNTYSDVLSAVEFTSQLSRDFPVNPENITLMGHSAGGHLALWAADQLAQGRTNISINHVVGLASITNLETYFQVGNSCSGAVPRLFETNNRGSNPPVANTTISNKTNPPISETFFSSDVASKAKITLIIGSRDSIVPASEAYRFLEQNLHNIDNIDVIDIPEAGHFDFASTQTEAWNTVLDVLKNP